MRSYSSLTFAFLINSLAEPVDALLVLVVVVSEFILVAAEHCVYLANYLLFEARDVQVLRRRDVDDVFSVDQVLQGSFGMLFEILIDLVAHFYELVLSVEIANAQHFENVEDRLVLGLGLRMGKIADVKNQVS